MGDFVSIALLSLAASVATSECRNNTLTWVNGLPEASVAVRNEADLSALETFIGTASDWEARNAEYSGQASWCADVPLGMVGYRAGAPLLAWRRTGSTPDQFHFVYDGSRADIERLAEGDGNSDLGIDPRETLMIPGVGEAHLVQVSVTPDCALDCRAQRVSMRTPDSEANVLSAYRSMTGELGESNYSVASTRDITGSMLAGLTQAGEVVLSSDSTEYPIGVRYEATVRSDAFFEVGPGLQRSTNRFLDSWFAKTEDNQDANIAHVGTRRVKLSEDSNDTVEVLEFSVTHLREEFGRRRWERVDGLVFIEPRAQPSGDPVIVNLGFDLLQAPGGILWFKGNPPKASEYLSVVREEEDAAKGYANNLSRCLLAFLAADRDLRESCRVTDNDRTARRNGVLAGL